MKWQFFLTHTIHQTGIPLGYKHTFCQDVVPIPEKKKSLSLYFVLQPTTAQFIYVFI
jgi:hypothetical protein